MKFNSPEFLSMTKAELGKLLKKQGLPFNSKLTKVGTTAIEHLALETITGNLFKTRNAPKLLAIFDGYTKQQMNEICMVLDNVSVRDINIFFETLSGNASVDQQLQTLQNKKQLLMQAPQNKQTEQDYKILKAIGEESLFGYVFTVETPSYKKLDVFVTSNGEISGNDKFPVEESEEDEINDLINNFIETYAGDKTFIVGYPTYVAPVDGTNGKEHIVNVEYVEGAVELLIEMHLNKPIIIGIYSTDNDTEDYIEQGLYNKELILNAILNNIEEAKAKSKSNIQSVGYDRESNLFSVSLKVGNKEIKELFDAKYNDETNSVDLDFSKFKIQPSESFKQQLLNDYFLDDMELWNIVMSGYDSDREANGDYDIITIKTFDGVYGTFLYQGLIYGFKFAEDLILQISDSDHDIIFDLDDEINILQDSTLELLDDEEESDWFDQLAYEISESLTDRNTKIGQQNQENIYIVSVTEDLSEEAVQHGAYLKAVCVVNGVNVEFNFHGDSEMISFDDSLSNVSDAEIVILQDKLVKYLEEHNIDDSTIPSTVTGFSEIEVLSFDGFEGIFSYEDNTYSFTADELYIIEIRDGKNNLVYDYETGIDNFESIMNVSSESSDGFVDQLFNSLEDAPNYIENKPFSIEITEDNKYATVSYRTGLVLNTIEGEIQKDPNSGQYEFVPDEFDDDDETEIWYDNNWEEINEQLNNVL